MSDTPISAQSGALALTGNGATQAMKLILSAGALAFTAVSPAYGRMYLTEFESLAEHPLASGFPHAPSLVDQIVAFGSSSTQSAPVSSKTRVVRLHTDTTCQVKVGATAVTAGVNGMRMPANSTEIFSVAPGAVVSVVAST
jgi:hypothetical protein